MSTITAKLRGQKFRRRTLEDYIEQLIAFLDTLDGDPDLKENGDDEPSIGNQGLYLKGAFFYDLERDDADDERRFARLWNGIVMAVLFLFPPCRRVADVRAVRSIWTAFTGQKRRNTGNAQWSRLP